MQFVKEKLMKSVNFSFAVFMKEVAENMKEHVLFNKHFNDPDGDLKKQWFCFSVTYVGKTPGYLCDVLCLPTLFTMSFERMKAFFLKTLLFHLIFQLYQLYTFFLIFAETTSKLMCEDIFRKKIPSETSCRKK